MNWRRSSGVQLMIFKRSSKAASKESVPFMACDVPPRVVKEALPYCAAERGGGALDHDHRNASQPLCPYLAGDFGNFLTLSQELRQQVQRVVHCDCACSPPDYHWNLALVDLAVPPDDAAFPVAGSMTALTLGMIA